MKTGGIQEQGIPEASVQRLVLYLRQLEQLQRLGQKTVSSSALGTSLGLTDAQVRKDLTYFGQFGHPGIGYDVADLIPSLRKILGIDRTWNVALVGFGNLGRALLNYRGLKEQDFRIVAIFDNDPDKIGEKENGLVVRPINELQAEVKDKNVRLGLICVPANAAQETADVLVKAGISGILNFAPTILNVSAEVPLCSVDLALELERLSFQVVHSQPSQVASESK
tara:strand:- start:830 stop:1501 length:672 start_codon:yes stop_codon:yes gene_type:complete